MDKHVSTHSLTHIHMHIKKLNPCMATFLTWYPIAKTFYRIKTFSISLKRKNNFGTYCIDVRVVTCFDTDLWLGHSDFSYLAIVQAHVHEVSSQMICKIFFSYYIWFIPFEQAINKHWYRNLIFIPLGMIDLSFEINQFHFIVTTMRVKPHENCWCCRQIIERNMHLHHNASWHLKISF